MSQLNDDEKRRLFQTLDMHTEQNARIDRGLYGDKPNKVKGALDKIEDLNTEVYRINRWIQNHNMKTAYVSGAVATAVVFLKLCWDSVVVYFKHNK